MSRNIILLLMMLLLVVSVPGETAAPSSVGEVDYSRFVISQTQMPVYELTTPEVDESTTEQLARSLTPIPEISAEEAEGRWIVQYLNQSFEVDSRDGSMWYADYDRLWNVALGIEVPTPANCRDTAEGWLNEKGLLPTNAVFSNVGSTNVTVFNQDASEYLSKVLQYHVNYEFLIGDTPVVGETAQISVIIGEGGDMLGFSWKYRETKPEPYGNYNLIEYESILEAHGISPSAVVSHRLVYKADEGDDPDLLLYPAWELEIVEKADERGDIFAVIYFDATLLDPQVEITTPAHYSSFIPGTPLTFDCNVQFGTPPYTYQWASDFDGSLSTSKSFTTPSLSEVLKKGYPVPHAISVRAWDAEGRGSSDCIAVVIETVDFTPDLTITLVAAGGVVVFVGALLVFRRRKGSFVLIFLLMLFSAFMFLPASFAAGEGTNVRPYSPSAPTGAYDDGIKEVGIEWVGLSHLSKPLPNTERNIEGFYNWMGGYGGYDREFNWGEWSAWEEDFKDAAYGGTDTEWIDAVDFVYYQDHGGPNGVSFTSKHDDGFLGVSTMKLGDGDLDTIVFDACSPLRWADKDGVDVFERWAPTLQGIHQVCSFGTTSHNAKTRGERFAMYMTGLPFVMSPLTIIQAWFRACAETEGSEVKSAVFYASKSPNPLNPQLDDPINDHAYGFGYVCSDPAPGTFSWYVYITSNC